MSEKRPWRVDCAGCQFGQGRNCKCREEYEEATTAAKWVLWLCILWAGFAVALFVRLLMA